MKYGRKIKQMCETCIRQTKRYFHKAKGAP